MNGYEINVAKKDSRGMWKHLFATDTRSISSPLEAERLYKLFKEKFPEPEYDISVVRWETVGHNVYY